MCNYALNISLLLKLHSKHVEQCPYKTFSFKHRHMLIKSSMDCPVCLGLTVSWYKIIIHQTNQLGIVSMLKWCLICCGAIIWCRTDRICATVLWKKKNEWARQFGKLSFNTPWMEEKFHNRYTLLSITFSLRSIISFIVLPSSYSLFFQVFIFTSTSMQQHFCWVIVRSLRSL